MYREVWEDEKREKGMEEDGREGRKGRKKKELAIQNEREEGRGGKKRTNRGNGKGR